MNDFTCKTTYNLVQCTGFLGFMEKEHFAKSYMDCARNATSEVLPRITDYSKQFSNKQKIYAHSASV